MQAAALDPTGKPVRVDDITVRTPGLSGTVVTVPATSRTSTRGATGTTSDFDRALKKSAMRTTHVVSMDLTAQRGRRRRGTRSEGAVGPDIVLDVPAPPSGWEQVLLSVDEHGVMAWHFGEGSPAGGRRTRGAAQGTRRYKLPQHDLSRPVVAEGDRTTRSLVGEIGKRIVKVIAFKVGRFVGEKARDLARDWENRNRPNGIRPVTPGNIGTLVPYFGTQDQAWTALGQGRALLFIHGTFGRTHTALAALPADVLVKLTDAYGGRVFAFDHHTISDDPEANARWFLSQVPEGVRLDLDIVCHSRGGLVARTLAERGAELGGNGHVKVARIALVAVPSEGTILASVEHWNSLIDTASTLVNLVGGPGIGDVIETILALVRQIAVTGYQEIAGLACMVPDGAFLSALNGKARGQTKYLAIASDYEPVNPDLGALIQDEALDIIHAAANDLMVRTDSAVGSSPAHGSAPFRPAEEKIVLEGAASVDHSRYFGKADLMNRLGDWLSAGVP